jgi:hypothetical protein
MTIVSTSPGKYAVRHRQIYERAECEFVESRAKDLSISIECAIEAYSQRIYAYARRVRNWRESLALSQQSCNPALSGRSAHLV